MSRRSSSMRCAGSKDLAVAGEHVIGEGLQRVALPAGRKHVERGLGEIGVLGGLFVGTLRRVVIAQHANDVAPLFLGDGPLRYDAANEAISVGTSLLQQVDDRQRDLALAQ